VDTEKCRVLLCAIETGSLTAAAEKMDYTPSGISRSVAALEEETGFPLLLRSRNGVVPTAECRQLLPVFRELLRYEEKYRQLAGEIRGLEVGEIAVGTAYPVYYPKLCGWIAAFTKNYPGIRVQIIEGHSSALKEMLGKGEIDFCIISKREGACRWFPLQKDQLMARVPQRHPLAERGAVPHSAFEKEPYIEICPQQETDNSRMFLQEGICPATRYATDQDEAAFAMVKAGLGITLVNGIQILHEEKGIASLPLDPPHWVEIGIALPTAEMISPAARKFAAFALEDFGLKL